MADKKLSDLTALPIVADGDLLYTLDVSDSTDFAEGSSRKATVSQLSAKVRGDIVEGDIPAAITRDTELTAAINALDAAITAALALKADLTAGKVPSSQLPIASAGALGAIRVGNNLVIDGSGILSGLMAIGGTVTGATAGRVLYVGAGPVLAESGNVQISGRELQIKSDDGSTTTIRIGTAASAPHQPYLDCGAFKNFDLGNVNSLVRVPGSFSANALGFVNGLELVQIGQSIRLRHVDTSPRTLACTMTTPSQLTGNVNNYDPGFGRFYRLSSSTSVDITGLAIASVIDGLECWFHNVGSNTITIKHQDTNSSVSNRIICTTGADITLSANEAAGAVYDSTSSRYRVWKL